MPSQSLFPATPRHSWLLLAGAALLCPRAHAQQLGDFAYTSNGSAIINYIGAGGGTLPSTMRTGGAGPADGILLKSLFAKLSLPEGLSSSGDGDSMIWIVVGIIVFVLTVVIVAMIHHWKMDRDFKKNKKLAEQGARRRLHRDHGRY